MYATTISIWVGKGNWSTRHGHWIGRSRGTSQAQWACNRSLSSLRNAPAAGERPILGTMCCLVGRREATRISCRIVGCRRALPAPGMSGQCFELPTSSRVVAISRRIPVRASAAGGSRSSLARGRSDRLVDPRQDLPKAFRHIICELLRRDAQLLADCGDVGLEIEFGDEIEAAGVQRLNQPLDLMLFAPVSIIEIGQLLVFKIESVKNAVTPSFRTSSRSVEMSCAIGK
jgi:hypothetical protein